jgi:DNA-binding transcriptional regulator LsrR (DeoR family)
MKRVVDDERMMLKVCDLYYNQGLGPREIASIMDLSRPTVSRPLSNARERGIVRFILAI